MQLLRRGQRKLGCTDLPQIGKSPWDSSAGWTGQLGSYLPGTDPRWSWDRGRPRSPCGSKRTALLVESDISLVQ